MFRAVNLVKLLTLRLQIRGPSPGTGLRPIIIAYLCSSYLIAVVKDVNIYCAVDLAAKKKAICLFLGTCSIMCVNVGITQ